MTISAALFPAVTVTVVRDRKIRTALRTNQIAGFVTVPSWKKNRLGYLSADIICSEKLRGTDNVQGQISEHIFAQMEAIVFITFLIIYKQQFLHSDWLRACQLIPNQCKKVKLSAKR